MSRMCFRIDVTCLCQGKDLSLLRRSASALQTMDAAASSDNSLYCHRYKSDCQATDTVVKAYIIYITHGRGLNVVTSSVISLLTKEWARMDRKSKFKVQSSKFHQIQVPSIQVHLSDSPNMGIQNTTAKRKQHALSDVIVKQYNIMSTQVYCLWLSCQGRNRDSWE